MRRLLRLVFGIAAVAMLLGNNNCSKNSSSDAPQFVTSLAVQNTSGQPSTAFSKGETIQFVITIRSRSDQAQKLFFNSSELLNVAVVDAGTASVVWACDSDASSVATPSCAISDSGLSTPASDGSGFDEIDFQPFETKTVTVKWNQADNSGAQAPVRPSNPASGDTTGQYEVLGGFTVFNTAGPGQGSDNGASMAEGVPTASQLFPSVYRSTLSAFTIQ